MSATLVRPASPGWRFWLLWMLATIVGGAAGLLLSAPFQLIIEALMGGGNVPPPWTATQTAYIMLFKGAQGGLMGAGIGYGQWLLFRKYLNQTGGWALATGIAMFLMGAFRWSLPYDLPPWQVGLSTALAGAILLGAAQWFVLRGRVRHAEQWIAINLAGSLVTLAAMATPEFMQLESGSALGMALMGVNLLGPVAVAGAGMIWLLSRAAPASRAPAT